MSRKFMDLFPEDIMPPALKEQAKDFEVHWVSEKGEAAHNQLSAGIRLLPTVSTWFYAPLQNKAFSDTQPPRTPSRRAPR